MKRSVKITVFLLTLAVSAIIATLALSAAGGYSDATTSAYEEEIERLAAEQNKISSEIGNIENNLTSTEEYLVFLDKQIQITEDKIEVTEKLVDTLKIGIHDKEKEIELKTKDIDKLYANFLERMRISYEQSAISYIELLFDADSLSDLLSRAEYVTSLLEYDKRLRLSYESARRELEAAKEDLQKNYDKQTEYVRTLDVDKAKLAYDKQENDRIKAALEEQKYTSQVELLEKQAEREKLMQELDEYIEEQLAKANTGTFGGGFFSWPLNPNTNYVVTCLHGWRTYWIYGVMTSDYHNGIDLRAYIGTPVYAANDGVVLISTYHSQFGYYILIDHGSGISTLYAHNSELLVSAGETVKKGQHISNSGNTGYSSGPHLHFELRINGERVDPLSGNYLEVPKNMIVIE